MIETGYNDGDVDIVEELRLRRWARENYVPPKGRNASWHPIVFDEMRIRDVEMIINTRSREPLGSYVPLAPAPIQHLHVGHVGLSQPNVAPQPQAEPQWIC